MQGYFTANKNIRGGISLGFDPRLAWRESDRDQKFDVGDYEELWVCAPRALYKISDRKSRAWMPGGVFESCGLGRSNGAHSM